MFIEDQDISGERTGRDSDNPFPFGEGLFDLPFQTFRSIESFNPETRPAPHAKVNRLDGHGVPVMN